MLLQASGSWDYTVRLWKMKESSQTKEEVRVLSGHRGNVYTVAFSKEGMLVSYNLPPNLDRCENERALDHIQLVLIRKNNSCLVTLLSSPNTEKQFILVTKMSGSPVSGLVEVGQDSLVFTRSFCHSRNSLIFTSFF